MVAWEQVLHPAGADWSLPDGYWHAADGERWRDFVVTERVGAIRNVVLAGPSRDKLAGVYAQMLDKPAEVSNGTPTISLPGPDLIFAEPTVPGVIAKLELEVHDRASVCDSAVNRGLLVGQNEIRICGITFSLL